MAARAPVLAQQPDYVARVQQLALEVLPGRIPSYYSSGARERAAGLQRRSRRPPRFSKSDSRRSDFALPCSTNSTGRSPAQDRYGIPWVSSSPHVAALPADLERSVIVRGFADVREKASAETLRAIENAGLPVAQAPYRLNDLIGYHEVGHVVIEAHGLTQTQHWLNEMLATFVAYAFMRERHPEVARTWDALMRFNVERTGRSSAGSSVERRYDDMPEETYAWFQGMFHTRLAEVYEKRGLEFSRIPAQPALSQERSTTPRPSLLRASRRSCRVLNGGPDSCWKRTPAEIERN